VEGIPLNQIPTQTLQEDLEAFQAHLEVVQTAMNNTIEDESKRLLALQAQADEARDIIASIEAELSTREGQAIGNILRGNQSQGADTAPMDFGGPGG
jgi:septal ring factor EnvC (AmiA/AmiB activator)